MLKPVNSAIDVLHATLPPQLAMHARTHMCLLFAFFVAGQNNFIALNNQKEFKWQQSDSEPAKKLTATEIEDESVANKQKKEHTQAGNKQMRHYWHATSEMYKERQAKLRCCSKQAINARLAFA